MSLEKNNRNLLRKRAAAKGIFSLAELARRVKCSRSAIYFAIEKPSRFPHVQSRISEILGGGI